VIYDNSLVVTITVTCCSWAPSSGDHLFTCGAIYGPPHELSPFYRYSLLLREWWPREKVGKGSSVSTRL